MAMTALSFSASVSGSKVVAAKQPRVSMGAGPKRSVVVAKAAAATTEQQDEEKRFRLDNIAPAPGSKRDAKRKGRGIAAGQGATCGFGMRGQKSRSGSGTRPGFEGGQNPLYRRLPKLRGIAGGMPKGQAQFNCVNISDLSVFSEGETVSMDSCQEKGLLQVSGRRKTLPLKILGEGEISSKLSIKAGKVSASAKDKLSAAGCDIEEGVGVRVKWQRQDTREKRRASLQKDAPAEEAEA